MLLVAIAAAFRNRIVAPLLRPRLEALLADVLDAENVALGAFEGSWIGGLVVHDVAVTAARGPLRSLRAATVEATYDLRSLLRGDLAGLRSVRITADAAELDLRGSDEPPRRQPAAPPSAAAFDRILAIAADGVAVQVDDLLLHAADGTWRGSLRTTLGPGPAARRLVLGYADLQVSAVVDRFDGERIAARSVHVALPAASVELPTATIPNPWTRPGALLAEAAGEFAIDVRDVTPVAELLPDFVRRRLPLRATLRGSVGDGTLRVDDGAVHVDRLDLALSEGQLALARPDWRAADAAIRFTATATDFGIDLPALGPSRFRGAIAGRIAGALADPVADVELRLGPCDAEVGSFTAATGTLRLDARGLADPRLRVQGLTVPANAAAPVTLALEGTGRLPFDAATAAAATEPFSLGIVASRPADPNGTPALDLAATVRADRASLRCDDLVFTAGPASLRGGASIGAGLGALYGGGLAAAPLQVDFELAELDVAAVPRRWLGDTQLGGRLTGRVVAAGTVGAPRPDVHLAWQQARLRFAEGFAMRDGDLRVDLAADGRAIVLRVDGSARLDLENEVVPCTVAATLRCADDGTTLAPFSLSVRDANVTADLALDLRPVQLFAGDLAAATVTGAVRTTNLSLASLPPALLGIGPVEGLVDADATVRGTLGTFGLASLAHARITLRGGNVRFGDGARLEQIATELSVAPQVVEIVSLSAVMGAGHVTATGSLRTDGGTLVETFDLANVDLRVRGDDALVYRAAGAKVRADADLTVTGTPAAMRIGGELVVGRGSKYVRRISVLPDLHSRGSAPAGLGLRLPALPPSIGSRLAFDVAVRSDAPFEARTHLFDGDLDLALRLLGTGDAPRLEGTVTIGSGSIRFPGAVLRVTGGQLTFTRTDPLFPRVQLRAEGKRAGVVVTMVVRGPYDRPEVTLSSLPPLPTQDLVLLLSTGQLPSTLVSRGTYGQARVVGEYLATEAWQNLFGNDSTESGPSLFDRVTVETGREVSRNGIESISVEYELLPDFGLRAERDRYEDFNLGIVLRFRLP